MSCQRPAGDRGNLDREARRHGVQPGRLGAPVHHPGPVPLTAGPARWRADVADPGPAAAPRPGCRPARSPGARPARERRTRFGERRRRPEPGARPRRRGRRGPGAGRRDPGPGGAPRRPRRPDGAAGRPEGRGGRTRGGGGVPADRGAPAGPRGPAPGQRRARRSRRARAADRAARPDGGGPRARQAVRAARPPRPPQRPPAILRLGNPARRINIGLIGMAFVLSLFAGRLVQLQGLDSKVYEAKAAQQRCSRRSCPRGPRLDHRRQGPVLAMTTQAREIYVDPPRSPPNGAARSRPSWPGSWAARRRRSTAKLAQTEPALLVVARDVSRRVAKRDHSPTTSGAWAPRPATAGSTRAGTSPAASSASSATGQRPAGHREPPTTRCSAGRDGQAERRDRRRRPAHPDDPQLPAAAGGRPRPAADHRPATCSGRRSRRSPSRWPRPAPAAAA